MQKPITISAQQHVSVALTQIEAATILIQREHGQVTPKLLTQLAILAGQVQVLRQVLAVP